MSGVGAEPGGRNRPVTLAEWCRLVCRGSVVKRGLKFAVVVGTILILINHGDALVRGELTTTRYFKMALTVVVPYVVSVFSSVAAMLEHPEMRSAMLPDRGAPAGEQAVGPT